MNILVTGGAGYIGSHVCIELIIAGYEVVVVDNLCNSSVETLKSVERITNSKISFYESDIRDKMALINIFKQHSISGVIHFAGLKSINQSIQQPMEYYDNNVISALNLIDVMHKFNCKKIIFSSSASVYGGENNFAIKENFPISPTNPYGYSKIMIERILKDLFFSDNSWGISILRYFNPIGVHKSGLIGEDTTNSTNNLMSCILKVIDGKLDILEIYGDDYSTHDGTGVRDYIHVVDLAKGHVKAFDALKKSSEVLTVNLGTGAGYSVFDVIRVFEQVTGKKVNYKIVGRRKGDVGICYADPSYALKKLNWTSKFGLKEMCEDIWRWYLKSSNDKS